MSYTKDPTENKIEITITSLDAKHIGTGVGTAMIYSIYRWAYFSYPVMNFSSME